MKYFHIIFVTFTAVAPKSHTLSNVEDSQTGDLPPGGFEPSTIQGSPHPPKLVHNYRGRDDHESRYKPHRDFRARPIHFIKRMGPGVAAGMVETEGRPISQHFYRIFIKDSPNFRLNHIIQSGGLAPYERSLLRVPHREHVPDWMYGFSSTSDKYREAVGGGTAVKGPNKKLEGAPNDSAHTRSIPLEPSPGTLTTRSTPVTKAETSLPRTDGKAGNKRMSTTEYGLPTGTTQKGNDKRTDSPEFNMDKTSGPEPSETGGVNIQTATFKPFTQSYVIPAKVNGDLSASEANRSSNTSETLHTPRYKEISRPGGEISRNGASHIIKIPETNNNRVAAENGDSPGIGSRDSSGPTYPGRDGVKTHSPEPVPSSDFQRSTVPNQKSTRIDHYFEGDGFDNKIYPTPDEVTTTSVKLPPLPANRRGSSKIHAVDDFSKWRKGHAYPAYGKHSSGEVIRMKMILDMKSGLLKNTKSADGNGYSRDGNESDATAKRRYPAGKYCDGVNCERVEKSPKSVDYSTEGLV